mmetsp:Transcript_56804/g.164531  ORF Transcript_56804/g.164531 Transcript_56804/m.164531 type:complete len:247 (-) Transcript_56804:3-743(-)
MICRPARLARCTWHGGRVRCAAHLDILWAPGIAAEEEQSDKLAGKIGVLCRNGESPCIVGARGALATARAVRALAKASEFGKSPLEFRVRWHQDSDENRDTDERALRFYIELRYTWTDFKLRWQTLRETSTGGHIPMLRVTPHTKVHSLATAMATEQRVKGGVILQLSHSNDAVINIGAKALATLPHVAQTVAKGAALSCVLRWNQRDRDDNVGKFIYAHVFTRQEETSKVSEVAHRDPREHSAIE